MVLPIILQPFYCGEGLKPFDPYATPEKIETFVKDAMPLVEIKFDASLQDQTTRYETEFSNVDFEIAPDNATRKLANLPGSVEFSEYWLTYASSESQPVYALTTGHLFYFHNEKSFVDLLGEAKPDQGEEILILKPLKIGMSKWRESHPGGTSLLEECAYLNVNVDLNLLKGLITKTTTEEFFKKQYKNKTGTDWQGPTEEEPDWVTAYLNKFVEYQDWPIIVGGGVQIASTRTGAEEQQRMSMFFKVGEKWINHEKEVRTFFKYHQRRWFLSGHPLLAKLLGRSVKSGTVDIIPSLSGTTLLPPKYVKDRLILDAFEFLIEANGVELVYHPLALDPDEDPHRLIVPRPPTTTMPPYLVPSLGADHWVTKLKISNPFPEELGIQIVHESAEVNVFLVPPSSPTEQVVQFSTTPNSPGETTIKITTEETGETGETIISEISELNLTFLDFQAIPVKFYKLSDPGHQVNAPNKTDMDEARLGKVIAYANEILGRQTNVYIYPVEENGEKLHSLNITTNLGDPITDGDKPELFAGVGTTASVRERIHVIFEWDQEISGPAFGVNATLDGQSYIILVDANDVKDERMLAHTLVHELGHWFVNVFIVPAGESGPHDCSGGYEHFAHVYQSSAGCLGGAWSFYGNLMAPDRSSRHFEKNEGNLITYEQAKVFITDAANVVP